MVPDTSLSIPVAGILGLGSLQKWYLRGRDHRVVTENCVRELNWRKVFEVVDKIVLRRHEYYNKGGRIL